LHKIQLTHSYSKFLYQNALVFYLLIAYAISNFLPVPNIFKAFLGFPAFLILPYLLGNLILKLLMLKFFDKYSFLENLALSWILGLFSITFFAIVLEGVNLLNVYSFTMFLIIICLIKVTIEVFFRNEKSSTTLETFEVICTIRNPLNHLHKKDENKTTFNLTLPNIRKNPVAKFVFPFLILLIFSTSLAYLLMSASNFPTSFAGDELRFTLGSMRIIDNSLLPQLGPYFPYLSLMQAVCGVFFNVHPISFAWVGSFFMYTLFSLGVFLLFYELSKKTFVSFVGALFAVSAFYSKTINLTRFVPMSWVYVVFPLIALIIYRALNKIKKVEKNELIKFTLLSPGVVLLFYFFSSNLLPTLNYSPLLRVAFLLVLWLFSFASLRVNFGNTDSFLLSASLVALVFLHQDLASIAVAFVYTFMLFYLISKYNVKLLRRSVYIVALIAVICLVFSEYLPIPSKYVISYFGIQNAQKLGLLMFSYGPLLLFFSLVGVILCFIKRKELPFLVLFFVSLVIYFLPASLSIRATIFLTLFLSYFGSLAVTSIINVKPKFRKKLTVIVMVIIIPTLFLPSFNYLQDLYSAGGGFTSTFTSEEDIAAKWIRENVPNSVVISDPYTQLIMSGLSGSQNVGEESMSGGSRLLVKQILQTTNVKLAWDSAMALLSQNVSTDYSMINGSDIYQRDTIASMRGNRFDLNLTQKVGIIVVTPRSIAWGKDSSMWEPVVTQSYLWSNMFPNSNSILSDSALLKFNNKFYFKLLCNIDNSIYIFKVQTQRLSDYSNGELENNATVLFDDQNISYWKLIEIGKGLRNYTSTLDSREKIRGISSLKINVGSGIYDHVDLRHNWGEQQDWSDKNFLTIYLYGLNDNRKIDIYLMTPDWFNFGLFSITDKWTGWACFILPLKNPTTVIGNFSLSNINSVYIANAASLYSSRIDRIVLEK
jgi:hypothetical protein